MNRPGIYTDYYELTMAQGYFLEGRSEEQAGFDYFFRKFPFKGGFVIFAGLGDFLQQLNAFAFNEDELHFLASKGFKAEFLDYLRTLELKLTIMAMKEGEVVFPNEPILRIEGPIIQVQIVETLLLNLLNFESLIATKARRICFAAEERPVMDFGLRRAQGYGGIQATKAAVIGGSVATSNVYGGFRFGLPLGGTMAHSWIQSYEDELTAFRTYAKYYSDACTLLVDTYDTLKSGVPNAITVAKELAVKGHQLKGIRLDSGDLTYLSRKARAMLNEAGLQEVKIVASNQLDEYVINSLLNQGAQIDIFGVGTQLVTGGDTSSLDGVYKMYEVEGRPSMKISENIEKVTLPGKKKVFRFLDDEGFFLGDGIVLEGEEEVHHLFHPFIPSKNKRFEGIAKEELLHLIMQQGRLMIEIPEAEESAAYARRRFNLLPEEHKRFEFPHFYKVGISRQLMTLRDQIMEDHKS